MSMTQKVSRGVRASLLSKRQRGNFSSYSPFDWISVPPSQRLERCWGRPQELLSFPPLLRNYISRRYTSSAPQKLQFYSRRQRPISAENKIHKHKPCTNRTKANITLRYTNKPHKYVRTYLRYQFLVFFRFLMLPSRSQHLSLLLPKGLPGSRQEYPYAAGL